MVRTFHVKINLELNQQGSRDGHIPLQLKNLHKISNSSRDEQGRAASARSSSQHPPFELVPLSISTMRTGYNTRPVIDIQNQKETGCRLSRNTQFSRFSLNILVRNRESRNTAL